MYKKIALSSILLASSIIPLNISNAESTTSPDLTEQQKNTLLNQKYTPQLKQQVLI